MFSFFAIHSWFINSTPLSVVIVSTCLYKAEAPCKMLLPLRQVSSSLVRLQEHIGITFNDSRDCAFPSLADYQIHFPVSKPLTIGFSRLVMNGDTVWDQGLSCSFLRSELMMPVFHYMMAMFLEFNRFILSDLLIDPFVTDKDSFKNKRSGICLGDHCSALNSFNASLSTSGEVLPLVKGNIFKLHRLNFKFRH